MRKKTDAPASASRFCQAYNLVLFSASLALRNLSRIFDRLLLGVNVSRARSGPLEIIHRSYI